MRFALPLLALALGGCGLPSLVGKWETKDLLQGRAVVTYDFKSDGTFQSEVEMTSGEDGIALNATGQGTYKLEKGRLTADIKDFELAGVPDAFNDEVRRRMPRIGRRPISGTMQWQTPDSFVLIENVRGTTMIFRRVKSN
ncbi:MAG: hypothetical protein JNK63_01030 [Chthonomonas sp.]|nr:hypothetical protein [Chthonomonas sp.]